MFWINSSPDSRKLGSIINTTANRIPRTSTLLAVRHTGRVSFAGTFRHTLFQQQCTDDIANDRLVRPFAFLRYGIPVSVTGSVLWFFSMFFLSVSMETPFKTWIWGQMIILPNPLARRNSWLVSAPFYAAIGTAKKMGVTPGEKRYCSIVMISCRT